MKGETMQPFPKDTDLVIIRAFLPDEYPDSPDIWHTYEYGELVRISSYTKNRTLRCERLDGTMMQAVLPKYLALPDSPAGKRALAKRKENLKSTKRIYTNS